MMARTVLAMATSARVRISADNGTLSLRGDRHCIARLLPEIRACKTELLAILAAKDPALPSELDRVIDQVAAFHGFTLAETREAKVIAAGDIASATRCFRALALQANLLVADSGDPTSGTS